MTNITHTFPSPYLRLEATADESTVVVALPSGMEKTLVTAEINPLTGGIALSVGDFSGFDAADPISPSIQTLVLSVKGTLSTSNPAIIWVDKDGVCYGAYTTLLYRSLDGGATLTAGGAIANFTSGGNGKILAFRRLDDGEALLSTDISGAVPSKLWRSSGFAANPATATWSVVMTRPETITAFIDRGVSVNGQYVLLSAYGYPGYGSSRQVYLSSDYGATFTQVFDTYDHCPTPTGAHIHGVSLDVDKGLIWCFTGDNTNKGVWVAKLSSPSSWVKAWDDQPTTGYPMRNCMLFGTDNPSPNGVARLRRDTFNVEEAYQCPPDNIVGGSTVFNRARTGDALYMSFVPLAGQGDRGYVFGSVDGENVFKLYECPVGDSVRRVVGPTDTGLLHLVITRGGTSTEETATCPAPTWASGSDWRKFSPLDAAHASDTTVSLPGEWYAGRGSPASAKCGVNESAYEAFLFDPAASETVIVPILIPPGAQYVDIDIYWTNYAAGAGDVIWQLYQSRAIVDGAALNLSDFNDPFAVTVTAPAQHVIKKTRMRTRLPTLGASVMRLALNRNLGTLANDAALVALTATRSL